MLVAWDTAIAPQGSFREQLLTPVYDQVVSTSAVGRQRGHTYGDGYFTMTIETHHIGGESPNGFSRGRALNNWLMRMNALGAFSDLPLTPSLFPTFPAANGGGVVSSSMLDSQGQRVTTLNANRADILSSMYLSHDNRLFFVLSKPSDNQLILFPSLTLSDGDVLNRALTFRGQLTNDNPPGAIAYTKSEIVYPRINLTEVL